MITPHLATGEAAAAEAAVILDHRDGAEHPIVATVASNLTAATNNNAGSTMSIITTSTPMDLDHSMIADPPLLHSPHATLLAVNPVLSNGGAMDFSYPSIEVDDPQYQNQEPLPEPAIPQTPPESGFNNYDNGGLRRIDTTDQIYLAMQQGLNHPFDLDAYNSAMVASAMGGYASSPAPADPVQAYAKLEFEDGTYYMKTLNLILGRDTEGYHRALRLEKQLEREAAAVEEANTANEGPKTPKMRHMSKYSQSVMSQTGGFVRNFAKDIKDRARKKSRKSRRSPSSDGQMSRRNSTGGLPDVNHRSYVPDSQAPRPVVEQIDPNDETFLAVHPSSEGIMSAAAYKKISRRHAKISYNHQTERFELEALSGSGTFLNSEHCGKGVVRSLQHQDEIQIFDLTIIFALPTASADEEGYATTDNGKQISFGFDTASRDAKLFADSDDSELDRQASGSDGEEDEEASGSEAESVKLVIEDTKPGVMIEAEEDEEEEEEGEEEATKPDEAAVKSIEGLIGTNPDIKQVKEEPRPVTSMTGVAALKEGSNDDGTEPQHHVLPDGTIVPVPERRGPGRPPKNGVMSKRRERELQRELQEQSAGVAPDGTIIALKNKRKYTKRKPKDPDNPGHEGSPEDGTKEKKEKKEKAARSPSPVFREEDCTPEQLAKPTANYVTLIHEALSNPERPMMSLPQIYRAITRKYPYFALKVSTTGWQSSVRHNLSQHPAFEKIERDGKGWMWAIVPGSSIEKEKKRRPTPPPQMPMGHHGQPYPNYGPPPPGYMRPPPPGYMHGYPQNIRPGPPQYGLGPHGYPPMPPQGYLPPPPALPPPPPPPTGTGYSSPYASKPVTQPPHQPQPSSLGPDRRLSGPIPPNQAPPGPPLQQRPQGPPGPPSQGQPPARPQVSEAVSRAVDSFRGSLVANLRGKSEHPELVVKSAIDRVLGYTSQSAVPGDPHEDKIMTALRNVINKIDGNHGLPPATQHGPPQQAPPNPPQPQQPLHRTSQTPSQSPHPQSIPPQGYQPPYVQMQIHGSTPPTVPNVSQNAMSPGASTMPAISRPGLGPQRPGMGSLSRPPMSTPGISRPNSGSPAPKAVSASPAPTQASQSAALGSSPQVNGLTQSPQKIKTEGASPVRISAPLVGPQLSAPATAHHGATGIKDSLVPTTSSTSSQGSGQYSHFSNQNANPAGSKTVPLQNSVPMGDGLSATSGYNRSGISTPQQTSSALNAIRSATHVWPPQPTAATFAVTNPPGSSGGSKAGHTAQANTARTSSATANHTTPQPNNNAEKAAANQNGKRPFEPGAVNNEQAEEPEFKKLSQGLTS